MSLDSLDRRFSVLIRADAGWECARCGKYFAQDCRDLLHCSHFWSRVNKSVRFDRDNCDALCFECHGYFDNHPREYREWKRTRLGAERFDVLADRARQIVTWVDRPAVLARLRGMEAGIAA